MAPVTVSPLVALTQITIVSRNVSVFHQGSIPITQAVDEALTNGNLRVDVVIDGQRGRTAVGNAVPRFVQVTNQHYIYVGTNPYPYLTAVSLGFFNVSDANFIDCRFILVQ